MQLSFDEHELARLIAEALEARGYTVEVPEDSVKFEDNNSDEPISVTARVNVGDLPELEDTE